MDDKCEGEGRGESRGNAQLGDKMGYRHGDWRVVAYSDMPEQQSPWLSFLFNFLLREPFPLNGNEASQEGDGSGPECNKGPQGISIQYPCRAPGPWIDFNQQRDLQGENKDTCGRRNLGQRDPRICC
jgi:hypothetical protein